MRLRLTLAAILLFAVSSTLPAQNRCGGGLNLTVECSGISIGNSARVNGLRINWRDRDLDLINGLNLTLWAPKDEPGGTINGLAFGLAPAADRMHGVSLGLAAVVPGRYSAGLTFGLLAVVSEGSMYGVNLGGLALVSEREMSGMNGRARYRERTWVAWLWYRRVRLPA
jgi:hypothetical protein